MNVLDKLLFNLQTIASVPRSRRISTAKEFIVVECESMMQGVWRRLNAESRDKAVASVCREVRTTITIAFYIMESRHLFTEAAAMDDSKCDVALTARAPTMRDLRINELKKIKLGLADASRGIDNLCQTYEADADVSGHLRPLINEINECALCISRLLIELGECDEVTIK